MKRFITSKKGLALLATLVVAAAAAIGAYAYFTSTGSDSSQTATVGSAHAFTVANAEEASQPALYPVATAGDAPYDAYDWSVTNNDPGVEHYASITAAIDPSFDITGPPDCTPADFSLSADGGSTWSASSVQLSSGGTLQANGNAGDSTSGTVLVQLVDNGANQDACQGATPKIVISVP